MNSAQSADHENMLSAMRAGRGQYTKADMEALCAIAVAGAMKGLELQTARAVASEREACAALAEDHFIFGHSVAGPHFAAALAKKIRERSNNEGEAHLTAPRSI